MSLNTKPWLAAALVISASCAGPSQTVSPTKKIYSPACTTAQLEMRRQLAELVDNSMATGLPVCHFLCSDQNTNNPMTKFEETFRAIDTSCDDLQAVSTKKAFCNLLETCMCTKKTCEE